MVCYSVQLPITLSLPLFVFCYLVSYKALTHFQKVLLFVCGVFLLFFSMYVIDRRGQNQFRREPFHTRQRTVYVLWLKVVENQDTAPK